MNKLKFFTALSKCFAYVTWAISNLLRLFGKMGKRTVDALKYTQRYDVDIFKGEEQLEKKRNVTHKQVMDIIDTIEVFPNLSIIISSAEKPVIINV